MAVSGTASVDADPGTNADSHADADVNTRTNANSNASTDVDADADTDTDTSTDVSTDAKTDDNTNANADTDTDTETDTSTNQGGEKVRSAEEVRRYENIPPLEPIHFMTDYFVNLHETVQVWRYEYGPPCPPLMFHVFALCGIEPVWWANLIEYVLWDEIDTIRSKTRDSFSFTATTPWWAAAAAAAAPGHIDMAAEGQPAPPRRAAPARAERRLRELDMFPISFHGIFNIPMHS